MSLEGKVALVTGGTRNIGRGISMALAEEGARVAMNYVNDDGAAQWTLDRFKKEGWDGVSIKADLAEMEASQMRGDLLPAPDVTAAWTEIVALIRARLLVLPDKIAPVVHETTSLNQARDVIKKAVYEILTEIAATEVEITPRTDGYAGTEKGGDDGVQGRRATAGPDGEPVGGSEP